LFFLSSLQPDSKTNRENTNNNCILAVTKTPTFIFW
jgi:hypothetical protein